MLSTTPKSSTLFDTTTPITSDSLLQQQHHHHHHHHQHFTTTTETTPLITVAVSGRPEPQDPNSTGPKHILNLKPGEINFDDVSNEFNNKDVTVESSHSSSVEEFLSTMPSQPEVITDNSTVVQLSKLSESTTAMPSVENPNGESSVAQVIPFERDGSKKKESISLSETDSTTDNDSLSSRLTSTVTSSSSTPKMIMMEDVEKKENRNWFQSSTKSIEEMEQVNY